MIEFFNTIEENFVFLKTVCANKMTELQSAVTEYINKFNIEDKTIGLCFFINGVYEKVNRSCVYLYTNFEIVKSCVDYTNYTVRSIYAYIQMRRIEPTTKTWSCVSALTKSYYSYKQFAYKYNELYDFEPALGVEKLVLFYNNLYNTVTSIIKSESAVAESLVTYKYNSKIIHRICNAAKCTGETEMRKVLMETSDVKFLSIEYHSRDYIEPVVLELEKGDYLINNEILSGTFIKRLLEYQIPYHKFDKNYTILLMDNNLKTVSLNFGEYIVLHKSYYTIMNETDLRENVYKSRNEVVSEMVETVFTDSGEATESDTALSTGNPE
jgi:hypothetical protein